MRADAIKLGEHHVGDAKFRFIEEGIPFHLGKTRVMPEPKKYLLESMERRARMVARAG